MLNSQDELTRLIINKTRDIEEVEKIVGPVAGARYKARIKKIYKGRYGDLVDYEKIRREEAKERFKEMKDRMAYKVVFEIPDLGIEADNVLLQSSKPGSALQQLLACYNGVISVGMEVWVEYTGKYYKLSCPPEEGE